MDPNPAWKDRWFELDVTSRLLKYYKNKSDIATKGEIPIRGSSVRVLRPSDKQFRPNSFAVTGPECKRDYFLQAKSERGLEDWKRAIEDAVAYVAEEEGAFDSPTESAPRGRASADAKGGAGSSGDRVNDAAGGGEGGQDEKAAPAMKLNLGLPPAFRNQWSGTMAAWRSVASLRGYGAAQTVDGDTPLVVQASTLERDAVLGTTSLAIRQTTDQRFGCHAASGNASGGYGVVFYEPGPVGRDHIKVRMERTKDWACTDLNWRRDCLLCAGADGKLRYMRTTVLGDGAVLGSLQATLHHDSDDGYDSKRVSDFGEWLQSPRIHQCEINPVRGPERCLSVANSTFQLWDVNRPKKALFSAQGSSDTLFCCSWDRTIGAKFVIAGQSQSLKILDGRKLSDLTNSAVWKVQRAHQGRVCDVAWNPLTRFWVASAGSDGDVKIWDLRLPGMAICTLRAHTSAINRVSWSNSHPEMLLSGGVDRSLRLWNVRVGPHYLVNTIDDFSTEVVGCGFSTTHPLTHYGVSANGEMREVRLTQGFVEPFVQRRLNKFRRRGRAAAGAASAPDEKYTVTQEDQKLERKVEALLYARDAKAAFKIISELANRYNENNLNQRAIEIIKLASGSLFRNLHAHNSLKSQAALAKFISDVAYYVPSNAVRSSLPDAADDKLIQLLKIRIALRTLIEKKDWARMIDIKDEIVKQLSENGDAFSAHTIDAMVATILPQNYLAGLNFAMIIGNKLEEKITFAKNFALVARRLFAPTIFFGGCGAGAGGAATGAQAKSGRAGGPGEDSPALSALGGDVIGASGGSLGAGKTPGATPGFKLRADPATVFDRSQSADDGGLNPPNKDGFTRVSEEKQTLRNLGRRLEREYKNPLIVLPQLKLMNEIHMALSRAFSKSQTQQQQQFSVVSGDGKAGETETGFYQPAEVVISVVEKYRDEQHESSLQRILSASVHRLYLNALLMRNKFDKALIYATKLSEALRGFPFAGVIDDMMRDVAFPRIKRYFDLALLTDRRRPWECQRLVQASLMLLRILHTCEMLPENLLSAAELYMQRFTSRLKKALEAIFRHPRYDGSQTLDVVVDIQNRSADKVDAKRDAEELVIFIKNTLVKIRDHGRGHQPHFPKAVEAYRQMLANMQEAIKNDDGSRRSSVKMSSPRGSRLLSRNSARRGIVVDEAAGAEAKSPDLGDRV